MNNPMLFYLALVGAGVVLAIGWLAIIDLRAKARRFASIFQLNKRPF